MRTFVEDIAQEEVRSLCGLVAALLPHLRWRHNGLGMLQAYVREGADREQRVHVWHPSLRRAGIERSGLLHDHRFDLSSTVLVGRLSQVEYDLVPHDEGAWQLHSVVPARKALAASGTNDGLVEPLPQWYAAFEQNVHIRAGQRYHFPKFQFHGTHTETDLVVTVVEKTAQEEAQAKILAPYGETVVHAFADPFSESVWRPVLAEAESALVRVWRGE